MDLFVLILADLCQAAVRCWPTLNGMYRQAKLHFRIGPAQEHATR